MANRQGRYRTSGLIEAQFEPGSHKRVLKNLAHITSMRRMELAEQALLLDAQRLMIHRFSGAHRFVESDAFFLHRTWLGSLYAWAGTYRSVNMSKGALSFASAAQIPRLMKEFSTLILGKCTPCHTMNEASLSDALATVHAEFILIHPFREGNGRLARWLASLMAQQSGFGPLTFAAMQGTRRSKYFLAVSSGLDRNYKPLARIFSEILHETPRRA